MLGETKRKDLSPVEHNHMKEELRELDGWIDDQQRVVKERLAQDHAERIHSMDFNPGVAGDSVKLLAKGQSAHHKNPKTMAFRQSNGSLAQDDNEQMELLDDHFQKVFNCSMVSRF